MQETLSTRKQKQDTMLDIAGNFIAESLVYVNLLVVSILYLSFKFH